MEKIAERVKNKFEFPIVLPEANLKFFNFYFTFNNNLKVIDKFDYSSACSSGHQNVSQFYDKSKNKLYYGFFKTNIYFENQFNWWLNFIERLGFEFKILNRNSEEFKITSKLVFEQPSMKYFLKSKKLDDENFFNNDVIILEYIPKTKNIRLEFFIFLTIFRYPYYLYFNFSYYELYKKLYNNPDKIKGDWKKLFYYTGKSDYFDYSHGFSPVNSLNEFSNLKFTKKEIFEHLNEFDKHDINSFCSHLIKTYKK